MYLGHLLTVTNIYPNLNIGRNKQIMENLKIFPFPIFVVKYIFFLIRHFYLC